MSAAATSNLRLPSKAVIARKWPRLRVNRMTGRWCDEASGAKGDDLQSLLAFLEETPPRKGRSANLAAAPGAQIGGRA